MPLLLALWIPNRAKYILTDRDDRCQGRERV